MSFRYICYSSLVSTLIPIFALAACGDDGGSGEVDAASEVDGPDTEIDAEPEFDAPMVECAAPLEPLDDGTDGSSAGGLPAIVISEINPGDYVEVYNTTDDPVDLAGLAWQWCSFPAYAPVSRDAITIPGKSYQLLPMPLNLGTEASGELVLYIDGAYATPTSVLDYVCWGGTGTIRKPIAEAAGKWTDDDCAPAITAGQSLHRGLGNDGNSAADYVVGEPTPNTCTPE